jgi:hypothetical protein
MVFKIITLASFLFLLSCTSQPSPTNQAEDLFKSYALSTCISYGFNSEETQSEASAAARGYLELGELSIDAHTEAALLGKKFLAAEYKSKSGVKLTLMKCIDFYKSKDLDAIYKKYKSA